MDILEVQKTKAHQLLSGLIDKGFLEKNGKGRSTYYTLKDKKTY